MLGLPWLNTLKGSFCNVFVNRGKVVIRTTGTKMLGKLGEQIIWRKLLGRLSRVMIIYLAERKRNNKKN
jgi:hypothetical protein